jgi:hypothetical protein
MRQFGNFKMDEINSQINALSNWCIFKLVHSQTLKLEHFQIGTFSNSQINILSN